MHMQQSENNIIMVFLGAVCVLSTLKVFPLKNHLLAPKAAADPYILTIIEIHDTFVRQFEKLGFEIIFM